MVYTPRSSQCLAAGFNETTLWILSCGNISSNLFLHDARHLLSMTKIHKFVCVTLHYDPRTLTSLEGATQISINNSLNSFTSYSNETNWEKKNFFHGMVFVFREHQWINEAMWRIDPCQCIIKPKEQKKVC